jgi:hypothetical protein
MSQLQFQAELPRTRPTLALESCADFFDRDYDVLMADVQNRVIKFAWDIAAVVDRPALRGDESLPREDSHRHCIRIYAPSAWAFCYQKPMPAISEDAVYKLILPNRDIRSTELKRILACSSELIHDLKPNFEVTREPRQADGPNSFTVFSRASIEKFLRSRRLS